MDIRKFERKAFSVEAVQVTADNLSEVAEWCQGSVKVHNGKRGSEEYVDVDVHRPLNKKQTQAFVTDWVIKSNTGWKVYTDRAFQNSFDASSEVTEGGRNVFERNVDTTPQELRVVTSAEAEQNVADEFLAEVAADREAGVPMPEIDARTRKQI